MTTQIATNLRFLNAHECVEANELMQAILGFILPDDETELKAAIQSMDCIAAIHDFRERLRSLAKYGSNYSSASEAVETIYQDYLVAMGDYL